MIERAPAGYVLCTNRIDAVSYSATTADDIALQQLHGAQHIRAGSENRLYRDPPRGATRCTAPQ
ncbi:hypothetical protein ASG84_08900 [Rhodococcus sp. Leaf278]|nr:hypothetical protein ASG84_08900 [Rhodococcus sp. Leaf278]